MKYNFMDETTSVPPWLMEAMADPMGYMKIQTMRELARRKKKNTGKPPVMRGQTCPYCGRRMVNLYLRGKVWKCRLCWEREPEKLADSVMWNGTNTEEVAEFCETHNIRVAAAVMHGEVKKLVVFQPNSNDTVYINPGQSVAVAKHGNFEHIEVK